MILYLIFIFFTQSSFQLQEGDLLFQDLDCGPFCESIEKVTQGYRGANLSHVGIVIKTEAGELAVIEAGGQGVVITEIDSFLFRSLDANHAPKVLVGRLNEEYRKLIPAALVSAQSVLGAEYDDLFVIENDKFYCSELVYESFKIANHGKAIFSLFPMTYIDPETDKTFGIWTDYFEGYNSLVPEGQPGLNPGGISRSKALKIVHQYGVPSGMATINPQSKN
ncbi:YiiX/YebB-like N1pC/P60 family cysteine hydrolase [Saprospiraceae bacterium]|nr:YiiX/YebB-like N1pC/P60 family cysteine hydrolase [Saprospiraceae bacterium]